MSSLSPPRGVFTDFPRTRSSIEPTRRSSRAQPFPTPAQRIRRAWWRLGVMVTLAVLAAATLAGCESAPLVREYDYEPPAQRLPGSTRAEQQAAAQPRATTPSAVVDAGSAARQVANEGSPEARRLAEQSQRDVDLLLKGRANPDAVGQSAASGQSAPARASSSSQPPANAAARAAGPTRTSVPPPIQWNTRPAQPPDSKSAPSPSQLLAMSKDPASFLSVDNPQAVAASQPAASQPDVASLRPDRIKQLTVDLARELYAAGAYSEHPLRELVVIAAMGINDPERKIDPAVIPDLTDDERAVLVSLQSFFASVGQTMDEGAEIGPGVAAAATALRAALVQEPQLKLPSIALCTRVGGFGDFSPFDRNVFLAGAEQKAIVYLEVADFVSEVNQNNEYVTELAQQLTLYSDRDGIPVWKEDWQPATDVTRNKRQDFFTVQVIKFPKALSVGKYTLKARVRDEKSKAESETSLPIEIVADPKMATAG